jgi:cell division protein ZipA
MTMLQLTLLILGILIIVAVMLNAWRERRRSSVRTARWTPPAQVGRSGLPLGDQMDIFGASAGEFDEFGVGRPRKVVAPDEATAPAAAPPAAAPKPASPTVAEERAPPRRTPPSMDRDASPAAATGLLRTPSAASAGSPPETPPAPAAQTAGEARPPDEPEMPDLVVVLFVAEREGRHLPGNRIHAALQGQGLTVTPEKIYQRAHDGDVWFSVASLIKPGALDPAEAARFSSPGLTLYLTVPGARDPAAALEDLLITSDRLAGALDADVFDQARQPLTTATRQSLRHKVAALAVS